MAHSVLRPAAPSDTADRDGQAREIGTVAVRMAELRTAISRLGVLDIAETKLGAVHVDINDVLASTRSAANTILEAAEDLLAATQTGNDYRMLVEQRMFALMEACSFQDLTGQRLQRVTHTLQAMEERLRIFAGTVKVGHGTALSGEVGPDTVFQGEVERQRAARTDANMVHGPGGAGAIPQETVDWLFATTS
jgi:chemotaxis protein CheZ